MTLTEMRRVLGARGIQLTKSLGQNFLHDGNQLRRIVAAAELTKADQVLEIGPGLGPLTELLVAGAGKVLAVEMDSRLVEFLRERFASHLKPQASNLELLHADALEFLRRESRDWAKWKLVANLPYSVASPLLVELAQAGHSPRRITATLQLEVARRLMAAPDTDDYGVLTLLVQLRYQPREWFKIPAACFFPAPEVESACVILERREQPLLDREQEPAFARLVKLAFSQRRKMMLKLLKQHWPAEKLERTFAELGISPQERAEKLGLEQFVKLAQALDRPSSKAATRPA